MKSDRFSALMIALTAVLFGALTSLSLSMIFISDRKENQIVGAVFLVLLAIGLYGAYRKAKKMRNQNPGKR